MMELTGVILSLEEFISDFLGNAGTLTIEFGIQMADTPKVWL
jgi:hypothetical protein